MRRSRPAACMMAAKRNADRQRNRTGVVKPLAALGKGEEPPVITSSIGISSPETPGGTHSNTHIRHAHTITASTACPSGFKPSSGGMLRMMKSAAQAMTNPAHVLPGDRPESTTFWRNCAIIVPLLMDPPPE